MTPKEAIMIARKYNLEAEIRQELASGLSPEEALEEWDINQIAKEKYLQLTGTIYYGGNQRLNIRF